MSNSSQAQIYAFAADVQPVLLCPYELSSLRSLITYIAHNRDMTEDAVTRMVASKFGVTEIADIARENFHHAVSFLVELRGGSRR